MKEKNYLIVTHTNRVLCLLHTLFPDNNPSKLNTGILKITKVDNEYSYSLSEEKKKEKSMSSFEIVSDMENNYSETTDNVILNSLSSTYSFSESTQSLSPTPTPKSSSLKYNFYIIYHKKFHKNSCEQNQKNYTFGCSLKDISFENIYLSDDNNASLALLYILHLC